MYMNAEHKTFKKAACQAVLDHYEEANENSFCQLVHDGDALLNKYEYQVFGMQFVDYKFCHNNVIALSFRKPVSHKSDKVAELAEEACHEYFELCFQRVFSYSAQDLATSAASK